MAIPTRRPRPPSAGEGSLRASRKVTPYSAGRYIGCPSCGRLLKIEWAVRSLVCSCGARVPIVPPAGNGA